ncbi:hypothetical protein ACFFWC_29770 [Plantactinospora siamensis]|uniref:Uncharacterized protein n=1 Tax=Plantactinospora siamensis TaxID=555372 RepID=A0ABV6NPA2_9ACTN
MRGQRAKAPEPGRMDVEVLPSVRWAGPAQVDLAVDIPLGGVSLGNDRAGQPAAVAMVQPRPVRIGLLGHPAWGAALAHRLLSVGCQVAVLTTGSKHWAALRTTANPPWLTWLNGPTRWPPGRDGTAGFRGPQVLIVDYPTPPPLWIGNQPWCTVVHASTAAPIGSEFWSNTDALLLTAPGYGAVVAQRWGLPDAALADDLRPGEIALADRHGVLPIVFPRTG